MNIYYTSIIYLPSCFGRRGFAHMVQFRKAGHTVGFRYFGSPAAPRIAGYIVLPAHKNKALVGPDRGLAGNILGHTELTVGGLNLGSPIPS